MKLVNESGEEPSLAFGGQALIEGIMIRSKKHMVICIRQPNDQIVTRTEEIKSLSERHVVLRLPFIRGVIALFETLYLGIKGLFHSANVSLGEEEKITPTEMAITIIMTLALIAFFIAAPFLLTTFFNLKGITFNIVEAIVRLTIFLLFFTMVAQWGEFKRVLQYHGAEHMTINAYEAGADLNVENVKKYSRMHPRCGTSFIVIVALVSIILFSIMPDLGFAARLAYRVLLIPLIGAISYEILKLSDRYKNSPVMKVLTAPGLGIQYLTTRTPDEGMIEVALKAVEETRRLMQKSEQNK